MTAPPSGSPGGPAGGAPDAFDAALADYNAQHGVADAPPPTAPPPPRAPSGPARAAAAVGGLVLVLLVTLGTAGFALAAFAGMGIAALIQRRRGRPYTRVAGWLGGVGGAMAAFAALSLVIASVVPANFSTELRRQMQAESRRPRRETAFDSVYGRMAPANKAAGDAGARAATDAMSRSPGLLGALLGFAAVFGVGFYGALVGSAAWGSATVLQFGLTGRWPARRAGAAPLLRPPPAPRVRDAFDAIR